MSKFLTFSLFTFTFSFTLFALPSWLVINTEKYAKDAKPSDDTTSYSAYYCTVSAAKSMFGCDGSVEGVTVGIAADISDAKTKLQANDATLRKSNDYVQTISWDTMGGQYVFTDSFLSTLVYGDYLAVVLYENGDDQAVRVLGNADWTGNSVTFDSQAGGPTGSIGTWAVPEPTSALLLLLGVAGLALRRKRG